jgi:hypothetical protein
MAIGPGKYDELCTYVREESKADCAVVMIVNGEKGSGFSVQSLFPASTTLPAMLRKIADDIEQSGE